MAYQLENISILVVEDNQPMLEITKALLVTFGVGAVFSARNGEEGFNQVCQHNPDIIIADWMMKPMDGITFTGTIRNNPNSPNPYVPILLMTGFSEKRRVLQARDAGVTEFLVKPFTARELYKRLAQIIERPRQFVRSADFFGPDRRRKKDESYIGPLRRDGDPAEADIRSLARKQESLSDAHAVLKRIREEAGLNKGDAFNLEPLTIDTDTQY